MLYNIVSSLSIWGEVLPVGGVSAKVEAAINAGIKEVIIPASNIDDLVLSNPKAIKIIPADNIADVIENAMVGGGQKTKLLSAIKKLLKINYAKK